MRSELAELRLPRSRKGQCTLRLRGVRDTGATNGLPCFIGSVRRSIPSNSQSERRSCPPGRKSSLNEIKGEIMYPRLNKMKRLLSEGKPIYSCTIGTPHP